jgi:hypothetical protein
MNRVTNKDHFASAGYNIVCAFEESLDKLKLIDEDFTIEEIDKFIERHGNYEDKRYTKVVRTGGLSPVQEVNTYYREFRERLGRATGQSTSG